MVGKSIEQSCSTAQFLELIAGTNITFDLGTTPCADGCGMPSDVVGLTISATGGASSCEDCVFIGSITQYVAPINAPSTISGFTEVYDNRSAFNPTTGEFTAPTTGIYQFLFSGELEENFETLYLQVNGVTKEIMFYANNFGDSVSYTYLLPVVAGQIVRLVINKDGLAAIINNLKFSGHLVRCDSTID